MRKLGEAIINNKTKFNERQRRQTHQEKNQDRA